MYCGKGSMRICLANPIQDDWNHFHKTSENSHYEPFRQTRQWKFTQDSSFRSLRGNEQWYLRLSGVLKFLFLLHGAHVERQQISLLQTLLVTCLEIMEIGWYDHDRTTVSNVNLSLAGIQTFDEQEKELKRRNNLKRFVLSLLTADCSRASSRSLARLASIPQNTYAVSLSRRRLTKEHKEGLVYCVWSMRGSLRAYQVCLWISALMPQIDSWTGRFAAAFTQNLPRYHDNGYAWPFSSFGYWHLSVLEPQVGAEEKLKLHKLQTSPSHWLNFYDVLISSLGSFL